MKMKNLTKYLYLFFLMTSVGFILSSCGDETPSGSGEASNEKFLGDYVGEVSCAGILATAIDDPSLSFSITETSPAEDDMVQVNLPTLTIPLELVGVVSGNSITMEETTVEDVMITNPTPLTFDVTAVGSANLAGNALDATIDLIGKTPDGGELARDKCTIIATKQ